MSNATEAEIISDYDNATTENYILIAGIVLVAYEYLLTLPSEVQLVWRRRFTASTTLFISNRILTVLFALSCALTIPDWTTVLSCKTVESFYMATYLGLCLVWAVFSALRVYAIGGRAYVPACIVLVLSLVPLVINIVAYSGVAFSVQPDPTQPLGFACDYATHMSMTEHNILVIFARVSLLAADCIILAVTWSKTHTIKRQAVATRMETPLVTLLLRDGALYFVALLALNAAQLGTYLNPAISIDITNIITPFTSIIVSRFLLNLREHFNDSPGVTALQSYSGSQSTDLHFAPHIVANMGAQLTGSFGLGETSSDDADSKWWRSDSEGDDSSAVVTVDRTGAGPLESAARGQEEPADVIEMEVRSPRA